MDSFRREPQLLWLLLLLRLLAWLRSRKARPLHCFSPRFQQCGLLLGAAKVRPGRLLVLAAAGGHRLC